MLAASSTRPTHLPKRFDWAAIVILLMGVWLRAPLLWADTPLNTDEALFASYARQISHEGNPLLAGLTVDKPPLSFYAGAASFLLFDEPAAWTARLPNFLASIIGLALLWRLTHRLYGRRHVNILATVFLALSPLDIAFAGSIFTDPIALTLLTGAMLAVTSGRWTWAGALLGLAFAARQSSLQVAPLVLTLGLITDRVALHRKLPRLGLALAITAALPFAWGALRPVTSPDWWALGIVNNNPGRLIRTDEVWPRLAEWFANLGTAAGSALLLIALAGVGIPLLVARVRRSPRQPERKTAADLTLLTFTLGYILVYWLAAFNTYLRYTSPLLPILAMLLARTFDDLQSRLTKADIPRIPQRLLAQLPFVVLLLAMLPAAIQTRVHTPFDSMREPYRGIPDTAAYLNGLPPGTIVYDHWLGWSLTWAIGQNRLPGMWLRLTYYPTPEALANDALLQPDPAPRYFVTPDWVWTDPWLQALDHAGFQPVPAARFEHLTIYRMDPP